MIPADSTKKPRRPEFFPGVRRGLGIGAGLFLSALIFMATMLAAGEFFEFSAGDVVSASKLNNNFNLLRNEQIAPVGSIVAWHRDLTGAPSLPAGWLECDGSVVNDTESSLHGQTLPDLNGGARFLRGGATSGTNQAHNFQDHSHSISPNPHNHTINRAAATLLSPGGAGITETAGGPVWIPNDPKFVINSTSLTVGTAASGSPGTETRPDNMSVIWIIRVK